MTDPTIYNQLDYLAGAVGDVEKRMIDPREFGRLEGAVTALKMEVDQIKIRQALMNDKLDLVLTRLSEAKGGWHTLMWLGGAGATLGAAITWFLTHTITVGPK